MDPNHDFSNHREELREMRRLASQQGATDQGCAQGANSGPQGQQPATSFETSPIMPNTSGTCPPPPPDMPQYQQEPQPQQAPRKSHTVLKVVGGLLAAFASLSLLASFLAFATLSVGIASCARSCSDSPIGDSRATARFISDRTTNDRDLATFDALAGSIQSLHDVRARYVSDGERLATVDELRAMMAAGQWPDSSAGYGDTDDATNPQMWVRIAELAQDHIQEATGERWDVVDLAYPFPDNGPIPVPATRDETDSVQVRLVCLSGEDAGLYANVNYWRWEQPARFEERVAAAREARDENAKLLEALSSLDALQGNRTILSWRDLYVWSQGDDDPLRDPDTFVALVNEVGDIAGSYTHVVLLADDTPTALAYNPLSYDYPNNRDTQFVSFEECREATLCSNGGLTFDHAQCDVLLSGYRTSDEPCEPDDLSGQLAPVQQVDYQSKWYQPGEGSQVDDELAQVSAATLQGVNEAQVMAISNLEWDEHESYTDITLRTWVVMPRGALPEDPEGFCAGINELADAIWGSLMPEAAGDAQKTLYCRFYVIDEATITQDGEPRTFEEMRAAAAGDVSSLEEFSFDVLLTGDPYMSLWPDDAEPRRYGCQPSDVGGSIAKSREWRYGD